MTTVVPFVSKADRERDELIRVARATYESIFPSTPSATKPVQLPVVVN